MSVCSAKYIICVLFDIFSITKLPNKLKNSLKVRTKFGWNFCLFVTKHQIFLTQILSILS